MPDTRQDMEVFLARESGRFSRTAKSGLGHKPGLSGYDRRSDQGADGTKLMAAEFTSDLDDILEFKREHAVC